MAHDEPIFGELFRGMPGEGMTMAEKREIQEHNRPLINALSVVVRIAGRRYGWDSAEHAAAAKLYDEAAERAKLLQRIDD